MILYYTVTTVLKMILSYLIVIAGSSACNANLLSIVRSWVGEENRQTSQLRTNSVINGIFKKMNNSYIFDQDKSFLIGFSRTPFVMWSSLFSNIFIAEFCHC